MNRRSITEKSSRRSFLMEDCSVCFSGRLVFQGDIVFAILVGINVLKSIVKPVNVSFRKHFASVCIKIKLIYINTDSMWRYNSAAFFMQKS